MSSGDNNTFHLAMLIISILTLFYCVAIYMAFNAYKEFKGIMEDVHGGEALRNNNIILYGTIPQRGE